MDAVAVIGALVGGALLVLLALRALVAVATPDRELTRSWLDVLIIPLLVAFVLFGTARFADLATPNLVPPAEPNPARRPPPAPSMTPGPPAAPSASGDVVSVSAGG
jgi:hypothetical protein